MTVTNAPATGAPGTNAGFFNNFFGGGSNPAPQTPVAPVTPPVSETTPPPTNNLVVTSAPAKKEVMTYKNTLANALGSFGLSGNSGNTGGEGDKPLGTGGDWYTQGLDAMAARSDASSKRLIANIQATKIRQANDVNKQYANYKSGLQLLGIQHNDAQFTPELLQGHIQEAETQHQAKLQDLDREETKALADAESAQQDNNFKVLKDKMDYVKQIQKEKKDALKEMYDTVSQQNKVGKDLSYQIYSTLNTLSPDDKEAFLQAVSKKYKLPLDVLTQSVADEGTKRAKATGSGTGSKKSFITNIDKIFSNTKKDENGYSVLGSDGFIDPDAYLQAYQAWMKNGFSAKEFATQFPANDYVNSDSYDRLPAQLKPKKSSSSSDRSG